MRKGSLTFQGAHNRSERRERPMSDIDKRALDANFQGWKQERAPDEGLSNCFSVISFRACREGFLQLFFPAGQVQVLPAG